MADEQTSNRGYPIPVAENWVSDDVSILRAAFIAIDLDVAGILASLGLKAAAVHGHAISDISGLQSALDSKASSGHNHDFASLNGVSVSGAPDGYVLVKQGAVWVPQAPGALLGAHSHAVADVIGLQATLDGKLTEAALASAAAKATPADADTLALSDSTASGALRRLSWSNIKAVLKTYFDTLYALAGHGHSAATASVAGFMSAADKAKLDGMGAVQYNKRIYTASATWTKPAGLAKVVVTALGAGGGAGHCRRDGAFSPVSGPGGGGELRIATILAADLGSSVAVTVDGGGLGGAASNANGAAAGDTSFGSHVIAKGGGGGGYMNNSNGSGAPGAGGTGGTGGEITFPGEAGSVEIVPNTGVGPEDYLELLRSGGNRLWGEGFLSTTNTTGQHAPANSGLGGGGVVRSSNGSSSGGNGGSGLIIVEEFF